MAGQFFLLGKGAAERRRDAECREQISRNAAAVQYPSAFSIRLAEEAGNVVVGSERLECVALPPPVKEVGIGIADRTRRGDVGGSDSRRKFQSIEGNEFVGVRERQRPKQDAIDQAEDGGGGSDAERKREDCGDS